MPLNSTPANALRRYSGAQGLMYNYKLWSLCAYVPCSALVEGSLEACFKMKYAVS